jgi:hypothetical protein
MLRFVAGVCRYAVKYNEQLLLTLEEDEFSCKQRLFWCGSGSADPFL